MVFDRPHRKQRVVIPVNGINRSVVQAVMFGKSLVADPAMLQAVFITTDREEAEALRLRWERQLPGVPLVVVESPYRALVGPLVTYLDVLERAWPPDQETPTTIVVLPEYVARHWWDRLLYNQAAKRLKSALVGREHTVIADVPYRRSEHRDEPGRSSRRRLTARRTGGTAARRPGGIVARRTTRRGAAPACGAAVPFVAEAPRERGGHLDTTVPARRRGAVRRPDGPADRLPRGGARTRPATPSCSASTSWRSTGRCRSTPTSRAATRTPSACSTSRRRPPRPPRYRLDTVLLQARDVGAAIVDEAIEREADLIICGLPFRRRFGGDFTVGRTIPYILKNAPCAVWVVREAMPEEQQA